MRARRTDANHGDVADEFERLGCSVDRTNDKWDLTIGYGGLTALVEVKDGKKSPSRQKLTDREQKFKDRWTGGLYLVRNFADVAQCVATLKRWSEILRASAITQERPLYHPLTAGAAPAPPGRKA